MNEKSLNSKYSNHFPNNENKGNKDKDKEYNDNKEYKDNKEYEKYDKTEEYGSKDLREISNHLLYHKFTMINEILDKRYKRDNPEMKNVSKGQGRIIAVLRRKDRISTKDLSEILNISVSSLNETLNKLEQKGFVKKVPSDEDKRVLLIELTEKGKEVKFKNHRDLDIFDTLDENEKDCLDEYLNRLIVELHRKFKDENPEKYEKCFKNRQEIFKKHFKGQKYVEEWFKL